MVWGDLLVGSYTHDDRYFGTSQSNYAVSVERTGEAWTIVEETACESDEGKNANAQIGEVKFGLPTDTEYDSAGTDGIAEVLQNFGVPWSSKIMNDLQYAVGYFVQDGGSLTKTGWFRDDLRDVRCVGRY